MMAGGFLIAFWVLTTLGTFAYGIWVGFGIGAKKERQKMQGVPNPNVGLAAGQMHGGYPVESYEATDPETDPTWPYSRP